MRLVVLGAVLLGALTVSGCFDLGLTAVAAGRARPDSVAISPSGGYSQSALPAGESTTVTIDAHLLLDACRFGTWGIECDAHVTWRVAIESLSPQARIEFGFVDDGDATPDSSFVGQTGLDFDNETRHRFVWAENEPFRSLRFELSATTILATNPVRLGGERVRTDFPVEFEASFS